MKSVCCIFILLLCGCSSVKLSEVDRAAIRTVAVSRRAEMPDRIMYHGPGQAVASGFGLIGAAIALGTAHPTETKIEKAIADGNVSVPEILAATFEQQLVSSNWFALATNSTPDAVFHFKVKRYGVVGGLTEPLHAMLTVEASLTNSAGKLVWRKSTQTQGERDKMEDLDFKQLVYDPKNLTATFENASRRASYKLLKHLAPAKK